MMVENDADLLAQHWVCTASLFLLKIHKKGREGRVGRRSSMVAFSEKGIHLLEK